MKIQLIRNATLLVEYGGIHFLRAMPNDWSLVSVHIDIAPEIAAKLKEIWKAAKTTACFDVLAWQGADILFCEAKRRRRDKLTDAQMRFIEGALVCDISPDSLLLVEWEEGARSGA